MVDVEEKVRRGNDGGEPNSELVLRSRGDSVGGDKTAIFNVGRNNKQWSLRKGIERRERENRDKFQRGT